MLLVSKTFKNELGAQIDLSIFDAPDRKNVVIRIAGPLSETTNTLTYREAAELRDALRTITI